MDPDTWQKNVRHKFDPFQSKFSVKNLNDVKIEKSPYPDPRLKA